MDSLNSLEFIVMQIYSKRKKKIIQVIKNKDNISTILNSFLVEIFMMIFQKWKAKI